MSEDRGAPLSKTKARWLMAPAAPASAFQLSVDPDQRGKGRRRNAPLLAEDRSRRTRAVSPYDSFVVQPRSVPDMRRAVRASDSTSLFGTLPRFRQRRQPSQVRTQPGGLDSRSALPFQHRHAPCELQHEGFGASRARLLLRCLTLSPPFPSPPGLSDFAGVEMGCQVPSARGRRAGSVRSA